jgi:hypothetical protein
MAHLNNVIGANNNPLPFTQWQMHKPIFIVRCPNNFDHEEMNEVHKHFYGRIGDELKDQYNVIVVRDGNRAGDIKFECYGSVYEEKEFLELKQQILSKLK